MRTTITSLQTITTRQTTAHQKTLHPSNRAGHFAAAHDARRTAYHREIVCSSASHSERAQRSPTSAARCVHVYEHVVAPRVRTLLAVLSLLLGCGPAAPAVSAAEAPPLYHGDITDFVP